MRISPLFILFSFLFLACNSNKIFDDYTALENNSWDNQNKLEFKVQISDTAQLYDLFINVRNAGWYPFSNLYLFIHTKLPDQTLAKDTFECVLANKEGQWLGDGLGDIWDNSILFKKKFKFPQLGEYTFFFEQGMRMNPLIGIADAGLSVEISKP